MNRKPHWESLYATNESDTLSWYQPHARTSLELIDDTGLRKTSKIVDVGGGDSLLVDELVARGYTDITVLDLSRVALDRARDRPGQAGIGQATWIEADIVEVKLPRAHFDIWHDRAVFHFLTSRKERDSYIEKVKCTVRPGGHVIVATFAEDGPTRCSGLQVDRYSAADLHSAFGSAFKLLGSVGEAHRTPSGAVQTFTYCWCRYEREAAALADLRG